MILYKTKTIDGFGRTKVSVYGFKFTKKKTLDLKLLPELSGLPDLVTTNIG